MSNEQGYFRSNRGCVSQIFAGGQVEEKLWKKDCNIKGMESFLYIWYERKSEMPESVSMMVVEPVE